MLSTIPEVMRVADLAEVLNVKVTTIEKWGRLGLLPTPRRLTAKARYWHRDQVIDWLRVQS